jgi:hypothetical protein
MLRTTVDCFHVVSPSAPSAQRHRFVGVLKQWLKGEKTTARTMPIYTQPAAALLTWVKFLLVVSAAALVVFFYAGAYATVFCKNLPTPK